MDNHISSVERNFGIDLLRIVSMIFVVILHVLRAGGILSNVRPFSTHYELAWLLEIAAYGAVNCYALISGYVGYCSKYKYANLLYLYFQVIFYTLGSSIVFAVFAPGSVGIRDLIKAIFPFAYEVYWYFTAYFCMFFFIPFMNFLTEKMEKEFAKKLIVTIFIAFSVLPTMFYRDMFSINEGYSAFWLAALYLIGASIRKYKIGEQLSGWKTLLGYFICIFATWLSKFILELVTYRIFGKVKGGSLFISYTSPTILGAALMLLLFFSKLNFGQLWKKVISFFAPAAFGVYIIHSTPLIMDAFMKNRFREYVTFSSALMVLATVGTAVAIWLGCSLIDKIRLTLFTLLKIKELCNFIEIKLKLQIVKMVGIWNNRYRGVK